MNTKSRAALIGRIRVHFGVVFNFEGCWLVHIKCHDVQVFYPSQ